MTTPTPFNVLIIDESPDFAKSLGNMIIDVVGTENVLVKYTFNTQDGLKQVGLHEFDFIFIGIHFPPGNADKTKSLFNKLSLYAKVKIIAISFHNELGFKTLMEEAGAAKFMVKDEIDIDELAVILKE
jgi:hypothetical protein